MSQGAIKRALWASSGFQSRTNAERKAYRATQKAKLAAYYATPEAQAEQARINAAHAEWLLHSTRRAA